jgi:hypothetical protein
VLNESETGKGLPGRPRPCYSEGLPPPWSSENYNRRETTERMAIRMSATTRLNQGLRIFFSEFVRVSVQRRPSQALFFARTVLWQGRAARRRAREARAGLHVPPIAIFSITNGCNLR